MVFGPPAPRDTIIRWPSMHSYLAYGLGICSMLPLPELLPGTARGEVVIRLGAVEGLPAEIQSQARHAWASTDAAYLFWQEVGAIRVRQGCEIVVQPAQEVEDQLLRQFILGPALALLLFQRGLLVLHASAIAVDGSAVAFLGDSGQGKSTTAAAFHASGYPVVADDLVPVEVRSGRPLVFPGFPQLKLWPEAAAAVGISPEALPRLSAGEEKRSRCLAGAFWVDPLPLRAIYLLAEGEPLQIEPLRAGEALIDLIRHSYGIRLIHAIAASSHLKQCAGIAGEVPIRRLIRPCSLPQLTDLVQAVEEDLSSSREGSGCA